jgi:8-oxo-dGTP diphosphatase
MDIRGQWQHIDRHELSWRPSVYAVIVQGDSVLLVPQRGRGYDLPGGGVEFGESLNEAVAREVAEETGFDISVGALLGVRESYFVWEPHNPKARRAYQCHMFYLGATISGGALSTNGFDWRERRDSLAAEWIPLASLMEVNVASSVDFRPIILGA